MSDRIRTHWEGCWQSHDDCAEERERQWMKLVALERYGDNRNALEIDRLRTALGITDERLAEALREALEASDDPEAWAKVDAAAANAPVLKWKEPGGEAVTPEERAKQIECPNCRGHWRQLADAIRDAVAEEREACARVVEDYFLDKTDGSDHTAIEIAAAIRARREE